MSSRRTWTDFTYQPLDQTHRMGGDDLTASANLYNAD